MGKIEKEKEYQKEIELLNSKIKDLETALELERKKNSFILDDVLEKRSAYDRLNDNIELKKALDEISDTLRFKQKIFEAAPIGIATYHNNGQCLTVNDIFCRIIGAKKEQVVSQNFKQLNSWKQHGLLEIANEVLKSGGTCNKEIFIVTTFGKSIWLDFSFSSFLSHNETHLLLMIYDISNRKNAEQKLKESEKRFRKMFVYHKACMLLIEPESGKIVDANKAAVKFYGYSYENLTCMFIHNINQLTREETSQEMQRAVDQNKNYFVFQHLLSNGEIRWVEVYSSPVEIEEKILLFSIIHDITERRIDEEQLKKYSEELKETNASKDKFFSIISHDLKSPFLGLLGVTEMLHHEYDKFGLNEIKNYNKLLYITSKSIYDLVENLLYWSRLQLNKIEFNPLEIELKLQIDDILYLYLGNAVNKEIVITNNIQKDIYVKIDLNMFSSILRNLISNAIKFTPKNGKIEINAVRNNSFVEISVTDTGMGINKSAISKLFSIDKQYSTKGTENETGTGLGLVLCKEMVEKHGGRIWVESIEGKGSTFTFSLPDAGQV